MDEYIVLDTETTGLEPGADALVEVAAIRHRRGHEFEFFHTLVAPGMPIPPVASSIHHLTDAMVASAPAWADVAGHLTEFVGNAPIIAHNAKFDRGFLPELHANHWLCTHRFARHIWPDAPGFSNQALRYWLKISVDAVQTHRAIDDARVTAAIFRRAMEAFVREGHVRNAAYLAEFLAKPYPVAKMPFGKHKGTLMQSIPSAYLSWAVENLTSDADVHAALRQELRRRGLGSTITGNSLPQPASAQVLGS